MVNRTVYLRDTDFEWAKQYPEADSVSAAIRAAINEYRANHPEHEPVEATE